MKKKNLSARLSLDKKVIGHLIAGQKASVVGGVSGSRHNQADVGSFMTNCQYCVDQGGPLTAYCP